MDTLLIVDRTGRWWERVLPLFQAKGATDLPVLPPCDAVAVDSAWTTNPRLQVPFNTFAQQHLRGWVPDPGRIQLDPMTFLPLAPDHVDPAPPDDDGRPVDPLRSLVATADRLMLLSE